MGTSSYAYTFLHCLNEQDSVQSQCRPICNTDRIVVISNSRKVDIWKPFRPGASALALDWIEALAHGARRTTHSPRSHLVYYVALPAGCDALALHSDVQ